MAYYAKHPTNDDYNRLVNLKWRDIPREQRFPQSDIEAQRGFKRPYMVPTRCLEHKPRQIVMVP